MSVMSRLRRIEQPRVSLMKPPGIIVPGASRAEPLIVAPPGVSLPKKGELNALRAAHPPAATDRPDAAAQQPPVSDESKSSPGLREIFQQYADGYLESHTVTARQRKIIEAISTCRTFKAGWHVDACTTCAQAEARPNSCGNRHCSLCQGKNRFDWVAARVKDLLAVQYYHAVFTLPNTIFPLCVYNQKLVYDLLFHSAAETLKAFGKDEQWLGAEKMGFFGVLQSWGHTLNVHPHAHFVVPAGGLDEGGEWVWPKYKENNFLFPVHARAKVFRGKCIEGLK